MLVIARALSQGSSQGSIREGDYVARVPSPANDIDKDNDFDPIAWLAADSPALILSWRYI